MSEERNCAPASYMRLICFTHCILQGMFSIIFCLDGFSKYIFISTSWLAIISFPVQNPTPFRLRFVEKALMCVPLPLSITSRCETILIRLLLLLSSITHLLLYYANPLSFSL